ncbi:MAG: hypothetical protein RR060_01640 [Victivallaceae bacterium]
MNLIVDCFVASLKLVLTLFILLMVLPTVFVISLLSVFGPLGCLMAIVAVILLIALAIPLVPTILFVLLVIVLPIIFIASLLGILKPASINRENDKFKSYIDSRYQNAANKRSKFDSDEVVDAECKEVNEDQFNKK